MKSSTLLVAGALALTSADLWAYQILESHFHVEVAPNKYVDQLVLRCEDGRQVTVPWQSKLAESCGEDLMGNVTAPPAGAEPAPIDEQQKQAMLTQLRAQYGNISEKQVEFISGPGGLSTRFRPPIVEVLKKYESCRKAQKDKSFCAAERDKALARLADPKPAPAAARTPEPVNAPPSDAAVSSIEPPIRPPGPAPALQEAALRSAAVAPAATEALVLPGQPEPVAAPAAQTPAAPTAPPSEAEARAAAEQKIAQDYMACMRAKPKFDCEQARTKALSALDKPKPAKNAKKQRKPTPSGVGPQAQR
ncbi:MAG TPA: hypothetical protein VMH26_03660 [Burkholderiales bacterium]|nr:hypothetical protein [Burkholderiales bacterium]